MRILLLALSACLTACATVDFPEVSRDLRDYQASEPADIEPIELPEGKVIAVEDEPDIYFVHESYLIAARANTKALEDTIRALQATERELTAILIAGQSAEAQAEIYRALYVDEARHSQIIRLGTMGAAGLVLLILTAGTL